MSKTKTNKKRPLVSVLICTYNRSQVLRRAITSVLSQNLTSLELVIIDDCSTDDTPEVVKSFADPRIRYIRNKTNVASLKGDRAHVKRFVYELMRGRYFIYLCDDDYWLSNTLLKRQINAFKRYKNVAMVVGGQLSYHIPLGCDLYLLPTDEVKRCNFALNGCYCWHQHTLSFVAPHGEITENIPINTEALLQLIDQQVNNNSGKSHIYLTNEQIEKILVQSAVSPHLLEDINNIPHISYKDLHNVPLPRTLFVKELYDKPFMTSLEFLTAFTSDPVNKNIVAGATLYSKKHFIAAGAMSSEIGSKWQAGYEFSLGPACCGNVVYLDEPAVIVEVRPANASFSGTQIEHYLDCLLSIKYAFKAPFKKAKSTAFKKALKSIKREAIRNVTRAFLDNTIAIKRYGALSACNKKNITTSVQSRHAIFKFLLHGIMPKMKDLKYFFITPLPQWAIQKLTKGNVL